jgi:hypothetical protein
MAAPRLLMVILLLGLIAAPLAAEAQQAEKVYRVGTLFPPVVHDSFRIEEIRQALRDRGYVEGQNLLRESRLTGADNFYRPDPAKERGRTGVDVIVTIEQPTTFELDVNMKTAKALGPTTPLSMLARVDQIIE